MERDQGVRSSEEVEKIDLGRSGTSSDGDEPPWAGGGHGVPIHETPGAPLIPNEGVVTSPDHDDTGPDMETCPKELREIVEKYYKSRYYVVPWSMWKPCLVDHITRLYSEEKNLLENYNKLLAVKINRGDMWMLAKKEELIEYYEKIILCVQENIKIGYEKLRDQREILENIGKKCYICCYFCEVWDERYPKIRRSNR